MCIMFEEILKLFTVKCSVFFEDSSHSLSNVMLSNKGNHPSDTSDRAVLQVLTEMLFLLSLQ